MTDQNVKAKHQYQVDIAIVGGGLSGLSAALTAAESGLQAIVLEKLSFLGGAGLYPEGTLGIGSRFQQEAGIGTTVEEVFTKVMDFHHWRCNAPVIRTLLAESGKTVDWLMDHGVKIREIRTMFPKEKSLNVWHIFEGRGSSVIKMLTSHFEKLGGSVLKETSVKKLMIDSRNKVTGVLAENLKGESISITAKAVVLATGGFVSNKKMLAEHVGDFKSQGITEMMYRGPVVDGRTGDGITLAKSINASLSGMGTLAGNSPYLDHEPAIRQFRGPDHLQQTRCALCQPFLWVNKDGDRFYNESLGSIFTDVTNAMSANGGMMWSIFDRKMKLFMENLGPMIPFNAIVVPGQKMKALDEGIQIGIKEGYAFQADTIQELAAKIGIKPNKLIKTIQNINQYTLNAHDPEFGRNPDHLVKFDLEKGPYYALKGRRAYFLTLGGVKINNQMQALNEREEIIPGLYVTGQDMGGLYDSTYDLLAEGSASSYAMSSGRIAVRSFLRSEQALRG